MIRIGIDQSLSFTGVTVVSDNSTFFYGITYKTHTKWNKYIKDNNSRLTIIDYKYQEKTNNYIENEQIKYNNIKNLVSEIDSIFNTIGILQEVEVRMEGISFGSRATTAIAELSALNYFIRDLCDKYHYKFIILPPTVVKKQATGNGQADKELMTESFLVLNPDMREVNKLIKLDDIADSYFMANIII